MIQRKFAHIERNVMGTVQRVAAEILFAQLFGLAFARRFALLGLAVQLPLQGGRLLRLIRIGIVLVPFEQLARTQNRVRRHIEIEVLFYFGRGDVAVEPRHLADELYLLGGEFFVAATARLVVYRLGVNVLFEKSAYRLARHFYVVFLQQRLRYMLYFAVQLKSQVDYSILSIC